MVAPISLVDRSPSEWIVDARDEAAADRRDDPICEIQGGNEL
jgi:hypothetical protein